ncbi:MAG TPA: FAD-dependent oxidoreductase [Bacteroidales bacterium]|nr:FAD-dependent oxidoreductase [Bacteroidales bacterium]
MKLTIDHRTVDVPPGTTLLKAAEMLGISIPTMCHPGGDQPHKASCMVCLVKDLRSGKIIPSCAMTAAEGMEIDTVSEAVRAMRREALELLLSDHGGDCEAPCRVACPAFMDIPQMNRLIASGDYLQALERVGREIALPFILGYICPAPCEKVCHRRHIDAPVSICLLKRFTASEEVYRNEHFSPPATETGKRVAVVGSGPAGLSAAYYLRRSGIAVTVYEKNELPGGAMRMAIPEEKLPRAVLDAETGGLASMGIRFLSGQEIDAVRFEQELVAGYDAVILATGDTGEHALGAFSLPVIPKAGEPGYRTCSTGRPGIFWCGHLTRSQPMAVKSAARGKEAAAEVARYLGLGEILSPRIHFRSVITGMTSGEAGEYLRESRRDPRMQPAGGYLSGFTAEAAVTEAGRCLHCDCRKPVTCKLRILSEEYGADRRHFTGASRKRITRILRHDLLVYEPEKCIKCGICVEISASRKEELGMTFIGRGFDVRIGVPLGEELRNGLTHTARLCAGKCPTGALALLNHQETP